MTTRGLKSDIEALDERVRHQGERMVRLEGKVDLLLQGLRIRLEPKNTGGSD